jgi:hypothetical protein
MTQRRSRFAAPTPGLAPVPAVLAVAGRSARRAQLPLAGLLTAYLAFRAGGFFPASTGIAATAAALVLVLRVTVAEEPFAGWSPAAMVTGSAAAGFACWVLLSGSWSGAPARAVIEFDRALLYVEVLVLYATVPREPGALAALLRWVLAALVAVCVAGLLSRLAPDLAPTSGRFVAERLAFPLTYWNAMGMASALALLLALHHAAGWQEPRWSRALATAAVPVAAVALYLSFSRGAIAACIVGVLAYIVLVRTLSTAFALLAALPATAVALLVAYRAGALATAQYAQGDGPAQGHRVAAVLLACCVAAAAMRLGLDRLEPRLRRLRLAGPRGPERLAVAVAIGMALVAAIIVSGAPQRVNRTVADFRSGDVVPDTGDARDRLLQSGNNGRLDFWRTDLEVFADHPLVGRGAGTYALEWERRRPFFYTARDGHSLYLETLAELGVVGLALLLVALLTPVSLALRRSFTRGRPDRDAHAAVAACGLALLLHAGADWDWEMPALFVWWFAAAGVIVAAPAAAPSAVVAAPGRLGRVLAGLACLLLAVTPGLMVSSQSALDAAKRAFSAGNCGAAVASALTARDRLPLRAEPYEVLGYCDLRGGAYGLAVEAMDSARRRDPDNWRYSYGLAVAQAIAGRDPRAAAARAVQLNPREPMALELARGLDSASPARRFRAAARATIPGA